MSWPSTAVTSGLSHSYIALTLATPYDGSFCREPVDGAHLVTENHTTCGVNLYSAGLVVRLALLLQYPSYKLNDCPCFNIFSHTFIVHNLLKSYNKHKIALATSISLQF